MGKYCTQKNCTVLFQFHFIQEKLILKKQDLSLKLILDYKFIVEKKEICCLDCMTS